METSWIKRFHTSWTKGVKTDSRTFMLRSLHFEIIIAGSWSSADALMVRCVGFFFFFFVPAKAYQHSKRMFLGTKTVLVGWSLKHQEHENTETMKSSNETNKKQYLRVNLAIAMITRNNKIIPEIILQTHNLLYIRF